jgi:hypothetical protein
LAARAPKGKFLQTECKNENQSTCDDSGTV